MPETQQKQSSYERTKELTDRLEAGIKDLFQSDKYKEYLKSMSHFHHYSRRNIMLINMQLPGATRVASFKLWDEKFNRHVKKGEHGIRIFAPIAGKTPETKLMEKLDPETGAPLLDANGNTVMEEMTALTNGIRFKLVPVFDISQTHGDPLPELVENLTGNVEHYQAFLDSLKAISPLPIVFESLRDGHDGYCHFGEKIGIREGMSEIQTISTIVHELTHARLHGKDKSDKDAEPKSVKIREVESESVSYVVCQHYGIETSPNSFGYLAEWGSSDLKEFMASQDIIRKEANNIITAIDGHFMNICKERGIDLTPKEPEKAAAPKMQPEPETPSEPTFTEETRTETIAGVDFEVTDIKREAPPPVKEESAPSFSAEETDAGKTPEATAPGEAAPDPAIDVSAMNLYGYDGDGMLPLLTSRALELYDSDRPIYLLYPDGTEAMAFERAEIETHDGIFGIDSDEWQRTLEYTVQSAKNSAALKEPATIDSAEQPDIVGNERQPERTAAPEQSAATPAQTAPATAKPLPEQSEPAAAKPLPEPVVQRKLSEMMGLDLNKWTGQDNKTAPPLPENKTAPPLPENKNKPVYKSPPDIARQNGELEQYRESNSLNKECAAAIDKAVRNSNYALHRFDLKTAAKTVTEEYGADRVSWVLANTIQKQYRDARFSSSNKAWAKDFDIPKAAPVFIAYSHPVLIDGFLSRFREAADREKKPSILAALKQGADKSKQQPDHNNETKKSKGMEV